MNPGPPTPQSAALTYVLSHQTNGLTTKSVFLKVFNSEFLLMFQDGQVAATVPIFNSYNEREGQTIEVNHFPKLLYKFFVPIHLNSTGKQAWSTDI